MALTPRQQELIVLGMQCYESEPKIDYNKLAALGNFKTAASANACYCVARKKLLSGGHVAFPGSTSAADGFDPTASPKAAHGRKRKMADGIDSTPSKRGKKATMSTKSDIIVAKKNEEVTLAAAQVEEDVEDEATKIAGRILKGEKLDPDEEGMGDEDAEENQVEADDAEEHFVGNHAEMVDEEALSFVL
ncbi:MAG: hypothetical protein M1827_002028 [Pycnora praestabilis]|nr:MAG: hypothetical protein M1827_002028 [Pycnora praestabilis]